MNATLELVVASLSGGLACWGLGILVARRLRAWRERLPEEASHGVALPGAQGEGVTLRGRLAARGVVERCDDGGAAVLQTVAARRGRFDHPHYPGSAVTTRGEGLTLRVGEVVVELAEPCSVARGSRERTSSWSLSRLAPAVQHRVAVAATTERALAMAGRRLAFRSLQAGDEVLASGTLQQRAAAAGYRTSAHRWVLSGVQLYYAGTPRRGLGTVSLAVGALAAILICGAAGYGHGWLVASSAQRRIWNELRPRTAQVTTRPRRTAALFSPSMLLSGVVEPPRAVARRDCWARAGESARWTCRCVALNAANLEQPIDPAWRSRWVCPHGMCTLKHARHDSASGPRRDPVCLRNSM
jgi:hypothetical protein